MTIEPEFINQLTTQWATGEEDLEIRFEDEDLEAEGDWYEPDQPFEIENQ